MMRCDSCELFVDNEAPKCDFCGSVVEPVDTNVVVAGQYEVERVLGAGGMGVVYLAHDLDLGRRVAIKVIAPKLARDPELVRRLKREAAALASIRHPHVVQVHSFGVARSPYFVMEYVKGRPLDAILAEHVARAYPIPPRRAIAIVRQVAAALDAVHDAGLVHGDVKPQNVVIEDGSGRPVIVDFGLVAPMDAAPRADGARRGTPQYMAPEQVGALGDAAPIARQADVFALGCTAYELLTGASAFETDVRASKGVIPPSARRADLAPFDAIIARALALEPQARFEAAGAFAEALDRAVAISPAAPDPMPSHTTRRDRNRGVRVLVVDDDDEIARYAARAAQLAFRGTRVEVATAPSGEDALASSAVDMPDLVILDYSMPGLDGIETLTRLRDLPGGARARILVFSANARREHHCRFELLGVHDFLTKPVGLRQLVSAIAAMAAEAGWLEGAGASNVLSA